MQQKIQFISTVVHEPRLLILDEPFSGLDPINTNLIKDEIQRLNQDGTTIIFSTHRMEQVEEICELIVLIDQGKNVLQGEVAEIKENFKENLFEVELRDDPPIDLGQIAEIVRSRRGKYTLRLVEGIEEDQLLRFFLDRQIKLRSFREVLPSLNEVFISK